MNDVQQNVDIFKGVDWSTNMLEDKDKVKWFTREEIKQFWKNVESKLATFEKDYAKLWNKHNTELELFALQKNMTNEQVQDMLVWARLANLKKEEEKSGKVKKEMNTINTLIGNESKDIESTLVSALKAIWNIDATRLTKIAEALHVDSTQLEALVTTCGGCTAWKFDITTVEAVGRVQFFAYDQYLKDVKEAFKNEKEYGIDWSAGPATFMTIRKILQENDKIEKDELTAKNDVQGEKDNTVWNKKETKEKDSKNKKNKKEKEQKKHDQKEQEVTTWEVTLESIKNDHLPIYSVLTLGFDVDEAKFQEIIQSVQLWNTNQDKVILLSPFLADYLGKNWTVGGFDALLASLKSCDRWTITSIDSKVQLDLMNYITADDTKKRMEKVKKADEEAKKKADEEAKKKVDEEAKKKVDEEAKKKADEEAKKKADEEAKKKVDEEAKKKADEEAKKKVDEQNLNKMLNKESLEKKLKNKKSYTVLEKDGKFVLEVNLKPEEVDETTKKSLYARPLNNSWVDRDTLKQFVEISFRDRAVDVKDEDVLRSADGKFMYVSKITLSKKGTEVKQEQKVIIQEKKETKEEKKTKQEKQEKNEKESEINSHEESPIISL